jgi:hypothetical protein
LGVIILKKQVICSVLGATILFTGIAPQASAAESINKEGISTESINVVAYDSDYIMNKVKNLENGFGTALPYKEGIVQVPAGYKYSIEINPDTNQSFYKIKASREKRGIKKWAIVNAFRYGGEVFGIVTDVVSDAAAKYIRNNSGKIADAVDDAGELAHGAIYQSLLSAGVPTSIARNIAWAIDTFLL